MDQAKQFRGLAARENQGRTKAGWRYSAELKRLAVAHVRERRQSGDSWAELSEELGVSALTLGRWLEAEALPRFYAVEVVGEAVEPSASATSALAVLTPGGLRIEGLGWPQVLELTRMFR